MSVDAYVESIAKVRAHFSASISREVDSLDHALTQLSGEKSVDLEALAAARRHILDLCSIGGAARGFIATSKAARVVAHIPARLLNARRGLTDSEVASARDGLDALRAAAQTELHLTSLANDNHDFTALSDGS